MEVAVRGAEEATKDSPPVQNAEQGHLKKKRKLWHPHQTQSNRSSHIQQPHSLLKNTEDIIEWRRRLDVPHSTSPRIGQVMIEKDTKGSGSASTTTDIVTYSDVPENVVFGREKGTGFSDNFCQELQQGYIKVPTSKKRSLGQIDHTQSGMSESKLDRDIKYYIRMRNFIERHIQELQTQRDAERRLSKAL